MLSSESSVTCSQISAIEHAAGRSPYRGAHRDLRAAILSHPILLSTLKLAAERGARFVANPGNLGDGLIQLGTYDLFRAIDWNPDIVEGISEANFVGSDLIVLGGGGAWVEGLLEDQARCFRGYLEAGRRLVLLPSSIFGFEEYFRRYASQVTLFVRERESLERLRCVSELADRVHLCHDLAFATDPDEFRDFENSQRTGTLCLFRTDGESRTGRLPHDNFDLAMLWNGGTWGDRSVCQAPLLAAAKLIAQFETVQTDRLHMTALAAMVGCRVEMHANSYFKNAGVYAYTLSQFDNVRFVGVGEGGEGVQFERTSSDHESSGMALTPAQDRGSASALREELARLARLRREYFEPEIARLNVAISEYEKTKREWFEPEIARLTKAVEDAVGAQAGAEKEALNANRRVAECFEPEIERLQVMVAKGQTERKQLLREVQDQRARVLYYIDQVAMLAAQIDPLRARTDELERLKRDWFDPEFHRMHAAIEEYEKTKREWFEAQLVQHQARLAELEARLVAMAQFESSRSYRAWRKFQKLYRVPLIGTVLRGARRVVGAAVRRK